MKVSWSEPGLIVSAAVHAALLLATLVAFSDTKPFTEAQESIPVEMITDTQLNQIMKGEKSAKEIKQLQKADKVSDKTETKPEPPLAEAKRDIPTPPPPLKRIPDPGEDDKPEQPAPLQKQAAVPPTPPVRPEPPKPEPPIPTPPVVPRPTVPQKAAEKDEEDEPEEAEPIDKKPPPRPKKPEPPKPEDKPEPPKPPVKLTPPTPPKAETKPDAPKPKFDQVAKLLEQKKLEEMANASSKADAKPDAKPSTKPASKPRSGDESSEPQRKFNPGDISKLLSKEAPQRKASTGSEVSQHASLGSPTANAPKMSPSLWGQLDGLLQEQYKQCWSYIGLGAGQKYIPQVKVSYRPDGSLAAQPQLVNPPSDPNLRSLADSAVRAVQKCNPLRIPTQFQQYYEQWKGRIVRFDPEEMT